MATDRLDAARATLRTERRRVVDEREAFEAFRRRLTDIDPTDAPVAGDRPLLVDAPAATGADAVRDAYRATVMSVPHYDEEYGEGYHDSLEIEFGPAVAAGLDDGLDPATKRAALTATRAGYEERDRFVEALDAEADSLADCHDVVSSVLAELRELNAETCDCDYGVLEAVRGRLVVLERRCDEAVADRQAHLRENHDRLGFPDDFPDLQRYLYSDLDVDYPALATLAELAALVREARVRAERRLATVG